MAIKELITLEEIHLQVLAMKMLITLITHLFSKHLPGSLAEVTAQSVNQGHGKVGLVADVV